jgi:hypothetical protein
MMEGPGANSEEKHEPASYIDTALVDSLKALDPEGPIREADIRLRHRPRKYSLGSPRRLVHGGPQPTFCYFPPPAPSTRFGRIRIKKGRSQARGKAL